MTETITAPQYTGTSISIRNRDRVVVDDRYGSIELVCTPQSDMAFACSCGQTGGLLILFDNGIRTLIPIGNYSFIHKV